MGLFYEATRWLDHVVQFPGRKKVTENVDGTVDFERSEGEVIQQGTPRNATNYNNQEQGILANSLTLAQIQQAQNQHARSITDLAGEVGTTALSNTQKYPFNSSGITIPIAKQRFNLNYDAEIEIVSALGGFVEEIIVYDKQLNGFKIRFTGSATSVSLKYKIIGGMYK